MKVKTPDFFWPSYADVMTSLFFIMLVLYALTYVRLNSTIEVQKEKLAIINAVEQNLKPLRSNTSLFQYEPAYHRFKLAFDVQFYKDSSKVEPDNLLNYDYTVTKIDSAGAKLKQVIDRLKAAKESDPALANVSYILVIAGYASRTGLEDHNYELSYQRALSLWKHWRAEGINFETPAYRGLIDLQIAGNGWGGVGRLRNELGNQRFLIQIFPKIGDIQ